MHILKSGYHQLNNIGILASYEGQKNRLKNEINIQAKVTQINLKRHIYLTEFLEISANIWTDIGTSIFGQQEFKLD